MLGNIENLIAVFFDDRVLSFDRATALAYAQMMAHRSSIGRPMKGHELDCQIAAIARVNGAAVATRNVRDFADCGVSVINLWETRNQ